MIFPCLKNALHTNKLVKNIQTSPQHISTIHPHIQESPLCHSTTHQSLSTHPRMETSNGVHEDDHATGTATPGSGTASLPSQVGVGFRTTALALTPVATHVLTCHPPFYPSRHPPVYIPCGCSTKRGSIIVSDRYVQHVYNTLTTVSTGRDASVYANVCATSTTFYQSSACRGTATILAAAVYRGTAVWHRPSRV